MTTSELERLTQIRHHLHRHPELSGQESESAAWVASELEKCNPDEVLTGVGGHGVIARFGDSLDGPNVLFRSELDALPIPDEGDHDHRSEREGVSHACGHDGHTTCLLGLAAWLGQNRPPSGTVWLLFQPAEETGEGAEAVMKDDRFQSVVPDRSYAFHNLPGFDEGRLYLREGVFASASVGIKIELSGSSSHAAYPEQGRNPARAVAKLISELQKHCVRDLSDDQYAIATVTYIRLGERAFGISPGRAEMGITLRAARDESVDRLKQQLVKLLGRVSREFGLENQWLELEPFAATVNDTAAVEITKKAAGLAGTPVELLENPFPWSEDFGHLSKQSDVQLMGIGSGKDHPHLHAGNYDFNDNLIPTGVGLFKKILEVEWNR
ncbi:MAG: amidohydrolase [Balneolaceae bacterium]